MLCLWFRPAVRELQIYILDFEIEISLTSPEMVLKTLL